MTSRSSSAFSVCLLLALTPSACSLTNDLSGYAGGPAADSAVSDSMTSDTTVVVVDTGEPDEDTGTVADATVDTATDGGSPDGTSTDTRLAETAVVPDSTLDASDTRTDTGTPTDTSTTVVDSAVVDSAVVDAADTGPSPCTTAFARFGVSELMVRAISGTLSPSDRHEWLELTNFGTAPLDVGGVTVRVYASNGTTEKATFTFAAATVVPTGESLVVASNRTLFLADVSAAYAIVPEKVFDFAKPGDLLANSGFEIRLYGPGCVAAYETAKVTTRTWAEGQTYVFPSGCLASDRYTATSTLTTKWEDTPATAGLQYGTVSGEDAGALPLFGSPAKPNSGVACP